MSMSLYPPKNLTKGRQAIEAYFHPEQRNGLEAWAFKWEEGNSKAEIRRADI